MNMGQIEQLNLSNKSSKKIPISDCDKSRSAFVDLIILTVVIGACGFLLSETFGNFEQVFQWFMVIKEVISGRMVFGLLGLAVVTASSAILADRLFTTRKCGQPGCRGLQKEVEFDIKIETKDCVKNSNSLKCRSKKGLYELPMDYHKELEAELKKMAPVNGRVALVFRGRCGCPVVRVEVPGPKKSNRKMKK